MRAGFSLPDVHEMTVAQLKAYTGAAERARKRENRDLLFMLRGAQYEKSDFAKLLKMMEE